MTPDYLGDERATRSLAKKIQAFWSARGFDAGVYVTRQRSDGREPSPDGMFVIRSAMVNGRPQEQEAT